MPKGDYYDILGVAKKATADEIRNAYRKLARKYHPDMNPSAEAQESFKKVQEAYDVLSDEQKRKLYDEYGTYREQARGPQPSGRTYTWQGAPPGGAPFDEDLGSIFEAIFNGNKRGPGGSGGGGGGSRRGHRAHRQEPDREPLRAEVRVPFTTIARGGTEQVRLVQDGSSKSIEVRIPKGAADGAQLRMRGVADGSDVILTVRVDPHPLFRRGELIETGKGLDLYLDLPVTVPEALFGGPVLVPTLDSAVELRLPPATSSGKMLRIKAHGLTDEVGTKGDLYAIVKIVVPSPQDLDPRQREAIESMRAITGSPRTGAYWPRPVDAGQ